MDRVSLVMLGYLRMCLVAEIDLPCDLCFEIERKFFCILLLQGIGASSKTFMVAGLFKFTRRTRWWRGIRALL
jgi:hypothetical protein